MAGTTSINQVPYATATDGPAGMTQMQALATAYDNRVIPRFASPGARDATITAPLRVAGMWAATGTTEANLQFWFWTGTAWKLQNARSGARMVGTGTAQTLTAGTGVVLTGNSGGWSGTATTPDLTVTTGVATLPITVSPGVWLVNATLTIPAGIPIALNNRASLILFAAAAAVARQPFISDTGCSLTYPLVATSFTALSLQAVCNPASSVSSIEISAWKIGA